MVLIDDRVKEAVGHEEVRPAIVVIVDESHSPSHMVRMGSQPGRKGRIAKCAVAIIVIKVRRIVGEIGLGEVEEAILVVVTRRDTHARLGLAVSAVGDTRHKRQVRERAVMVVVVQNACRRVTRHIKIRPAVVVIIEAESTQGIVLAGKKNDSRFLTDVRKCSVTVIVIKEISSGSEPTWPARHRDTLVLAELSRPRLRKQVKVFSLVNVIGDKQIEPSVPVVVKKDTSRVPSPRIARHSCLFSDFGKRAVSIVVIEQILPVASHKNIVPPVVVIVTDTHALSPSGMNKSDFHCNVGECAVPLVVEEAVRGRLSRGKAFDGSSVHQKDIGVAVPVVVDPSDAAAGGFEEISFSCCRAEDILKVQSRLPADLNVRDSQQRLVYTAGSPCRQNDLSHGCLGRGCRNQGYKSPAVHQKHLSTQETPSLSREDCSETAASLLNWVFTALSSISHRFYTRESRPRRLIFRWADDRAKPTCKVIIGSIVRVFPCWNKSGVLTLLLGVLIVLGASILPAAPSQQALAHLGAGLKLFGLQRYAGAAREFKLALNVDPSLLNARYHLAVSYFRERQFGDSQQQFEQLAATDYRRRWVIYYLGRLDLQRGHFNEAIQRFESLGGRQPLHDELYYLGSAFLQKGDAKRAVQFLRKEIAFNPRDFRAYYLLGRAYMNLHQTFQAQRQFEESERLHQYYLQGKLELAGCRQQLQAGREREAWARCGSVLQTNDIDKLVAVGMLFGEFSDYGYAVEALRKALALDPESPEINYDLGYTYYQMKDYASASRYSQAALAKRPDFFEALEVYGMALHRSGKDSAARPVLARAHELRPDDSTITEVLAQIESLSAR